MEMLGVLLLAFVLVVAAESYSTAEAAAETEARVLDNLFEVAEFAPRTPSASRPTPSATPERSLRWT
jgi:hypothetical protein